MGMKVSYRNYSYGNQEQFLKPVIYCNPTDKEKSHAVSLNIQLAEKLSKIKPHLRTMRMEQCFNQVLAALPDNTILKDYDVLFSPDYQIDVMKMLISACKKKPFQIIWAGKYKDDVLYYAEEGCKDFKAYTIEEYDITCVI